MFIRSINITREGDFGYGRADFSKPLKAKITVGNESAETTINLSPGATERLLAVLKDEVLISAEEVAKSFTASIFDIKQPQLAAPLPNLDEEIPF